MEMIELKKKSYFCIILVKPDLQRMISLIWKLKIFRFILVQDDLSVTYYSLSHAKNTSVDLKKSFTITTAFYTDGNTSKPGSLSLHFLFVQKIKFKKLYIRQINKHWILQSTGIALGTCYVYLMQQALENFPICSSEGRLGCIFYPNGRNFILYLRRNRRRFRNAYET